MSTKWAIETLYDGQFLESLASLVDGSESTKMKFQILLISDHLNANFKIQSPILWSGMSAFGLTKSEAVEKWIKENIKRFNE